MQTHRLLQATTTPAIYAAIMCPNNTVCRTPQPITDDMPYYVAQTNRILWERWEAAAIALNNLRVQGGHEREIARILRRFPGVEELFPASRFEADHEPFDVYDSSNRFEVWH